MSDEFYEVQSLRLGEVSAALHATAARVVKKACFDIVAYAMQNHPFQNQTGFAQSSIYARTHDASTYGQTTGSGELLPELPAPESDLEGWVGWGANYGLFLETGTSHMPAYPTLGPAAQFVGAALEGAFGALQGAMDQAAGSGGESGGGE